MKKNLVIVESPAKAKTLGKILGNKYSLKASLGHIRDLPKSQLGVDIENDFAPKYVVPRDKQKIVTELKQAAKTASAIYLATDPDREGEAISWHLMEITNSNNKPYHRVVFHEITREAIEQAFKNPRSIDMHLVQAQQARRVLDRLVGYKLSPLLWRKVRRGLSAGRVQSVALKIIVDREREIQKFVPVEYWTIEAELAKKPVTAKTPTFRASLVSLADGTKLNIPDEKEAGRIKSELEKADYIVNNVSTKKVVRQPAPPFITSTLQQEAWRQLHFTAKQTMVTAQQLYEGLPIGNEGEVGLITYMRTDSTHIAESALAETRELIKEKYGAEYLPPRARVFTRKVKGAQEAHEAIRPTRIHREPEMIRKYLNNTQFKLYQLIWKRMIASQMAAAIYDNTTVDIEATHPNSKPGYLFRASDSINKFPGFTILYIEGKDESEEDGKVSPLPKLSKSDKLKLIELFAKQNFTQPPPRFTEATLIKLLEQKGIGRPSTYAPILSTIQEREYVNKMKGSFHPTELGFVVSDLLSDYFTDIVDIKFTARMEKELDEVAQENRDWKNVVREFYKPLEKDLTQASEKIERVKLPDELTTEVCPKCGKPLAIKIGRFGKFLACSGYPECKYTQTYQIKIGVKCPQCGGEIIQRLNKKRRTFYGCSSYPACNFATSFKPLSQPCPKCGGLLTQYPGNRVKCTKCEYRGKLKEEDTDSSIKEPAKTAKR